ncbi:MAG: lytic transglycosylase domain-containing protein [Bacteriovoracaceae bacterium]
MKILLVLLLSFNIFATENKTEPDFKQVATDFNNINLANDLLMMLKQLRADQGIKVSLTSINKKLAKTPLFENFKDLVDNLLKISSIKNINGFKENCLDIIERKKAIADKDFNENLVFVCNKKLLKIISIQPELLTSNNEVVEILKKQLPAIIEYKEAQFFIRYLESIEKNKAFQPLVKIMASREPKLTYAPELIKYLKKTKEFKDYLPEVNLALNYNTELSSSLKSFVKEIDDLKHNSDYIKYKTNEFSTFIKNNNQNLDSQKTWTSLNSYAKSLLIRKNYQTSRQIYELAFDYIKDTKTFKTVEDEEKYYNNVFQIAWTYLVQRDYKGCYSFFDKLSYYSNYKSLPSRIKFWMAYSAEQIDKKSLSQKIYQNVIETNPLHFYAIMSQKKINSNKKDSGFVLQEIKDVNNVWPETPQTGSSNEKIYTEKFNLALAELYIWTKLQATYLINKQIDEIVALEKAHVFKDQPRVALNDEDIRSYLILRVANILFENNYFLGTFKIIYTALNSEKVKVDKKLLSVLFPFEYFENIKNTDTNIDPIIILSLVRQESAFNPKAISPVGALGLMQLMPFTAKTISKKNSDKKSLFIPDNNLKTGIKYFKKMYDRYEGNLVHTLCAYNAGEKNLAKWMKDIFDTNDILFTIESIPFDETKTYVQLIIRNIYFYKMLLKSSMESTELSKIFDVDLTVAAQKKVEN